MCQQRRNRGQRKRVLRMSTSSDFPRGKERHLQLSCWVSKAGSGPGEYGEAPSSLEAIPYAPSLLAPSDKPHPEIWGQGEVPAWSHALSASASKASVSPEWFQTTRPPEQLMCPRSPWPKCRAGEREQLTVGIADARPGPATALCGGLQAGVPDLSPLQVPMCSWARNLQGPSSSVIPRLQGQASSCLQHQRERLSRGGEM